MGLKDLKVLLEKDKRVYLIMAIWIIIGYTIFQFSYSTLWGMIVFIPLLFTCFFYFIVSIILKEKIQKYDWKVFFISLVIGIILFFCVFWIEIIYLMFFYISLIGINLFLFLAVIFTSRDWYNRTVQWDEKIANLTSRLSTLIRFSLFFGGAIVATLIIILFSTLALNIKGTSDYYQVAITSIMYDSILFIWILFIIGILTVFFGKVNYWLGTFFLFISILVVYLIINATISELGVSSILLPFLIIQYVINLYLLFGSIAFIFREQSEIISQKSNIFRSESILVLLIFSMASMQLYLGISDGSVGQLELMFSMLIPILLFLFGIYGIYNYIKKYKKEKNLKNLNLNE